jgi:hypothetical protein
MAESGGVAIFSSTDMRNLPQLPNHRVNVLELIDFIVY